MQIVHDLIDAYTKHIGLPLILVNLEGEVVYKKSFSDIPFEKKDYREFVRIGASLDFSTIISHVDELLKSEVLYMVSPIMKVQAERYILIAGPYVLKETDLNCVQMKNKIIMMDPMKEEALVNKFHNLLFVLTAKHEIESNVIVSKEMTDLVYLFDDFTPENVLENDLFEVIAQRLYKLKSIDFVGYAQKTSHNMYEIRYVLGNRVEHLQGKRFYYGEGLLGQVFLHNQSFFWEKQHNDTSHLGFFIRHAIFPEQLFGIPLMKGNKEETLIFGGSFVANQLHSTDITLLNHLALLMMQKNQTHRKLTSINHCQVVIKEWLCFLDLIYEYKNQPLLAYKLLDFCEVLNEEHACCVTTIQGQTIVRNNNGEILSKHAMFEALEKNQLYFIQQEETYIHFYFQNLGSYTVDFSNKCTYYPETMIITSILKLIGLVNTSTSHYYGENENLDLFEHYYLAMEEMNLEKFNKAKMAIRFIEILHEQKKLNQFSYEVLLKFCKISPYSYDFIQRQIEHSYELTVLKELLSMSANMHVVTFEYKIIAYIDQEIIKENRFKMQQLSEEERMQLNAVLEQVQRELTDNLSLSVSPIATHNLTKESLSLATKPFFMTKRENDVMYLLVDGYSNQEIADTLNISSHTVKNHITNIYKKLRVVDRYHAVKKILNF